MERQCLLWVSNFEPILDTLLVRCGCDSSHCERIVFLLLFVVKHGPDSLHRFVLDSAQPFDANASRDGRVPPKLSGLLLPLFDDLLYSDLLRLVEVESCGKRFDAIIKIGASVSRMRGLCRGSRSTIRLSHQGRSQ